MIGEELETCLRWWSARERGQWPNRSERGSEALAEELLALGLLERTHDGEPRFRPTARGRALLGESRG
jgi:hypothetical protein